MEGLDFLDCCALMSHVNSSARRSLAGMSPIRAFPCDYGEAGAALLAAPGIEEVPSGELWLKSGLVDRRRALRGTPPLGL